MSASTPLPIALVGLPGVGKSTVARELERQLGCTRVDLDETIAAHQGHTIAQILALRGEPAFRRLEQVALSQALSDGVGVIACGGGVLTRPECAVLLHEHTAVVWLDAPDDVLLARLGDATGRPLLEAGPPARLATLREQRHGGYAGAQARVDADAAPGEVAVRVRTALGR